jgi:chemotaxis protein MotB
MKNQNAHLKSVRLKNISNLKTFFMSTKSTMSFLLLVAVILCSCGSGRKAAEEQVVNLQAENGQLTTQVNDLKKQVADLSTQNKAATDQVTSVTTQFDSYKKQCQANDEKMKAVSAAMTELEVNMQKLENRIEEAESDFKDKGLEVESKNGVIHVNMQDNLLYKSGSATLSPDGKKALGNLAAVLNEYPKLEVIVVGNTDSVKMKGSKDNWSLSTERANGVVRILRDTYNVDPARLVAAGKGKYSPVADNSTVEGRAKNRRTEIVLNPDWQRIWQSVKNEGKTE